MNHTIALIVLIVISGAFTGGPNCGRGGDGICGGGGRFGGEGYEDYKNHICAENSITCSDDGSETCPDESMKPALNLKDQKNGRNASAVLIGSKRRRRRSRHAVTLPELIATLPIVLLGASCGMAAGVVVGVMAVRVRSDHSRLKRRSLRVPSVTAAEIRSLLRCG